VTVRARLAVPLAGIAVTVGAGAAVTDVPATAGGLTATGLASEVAPPVFSGAGLPDTTVGEEGVGVTRLTSMIGSIASQTVVTAVTGRGDDTLAGVGSTITGAIAVVTSA
jgi:hypothetical protein